MTITPVTLNLRHPVTVSMVTISEPCDDWPEIAVWCGGESVGPRGIEIPDVDQPATLGQVIVMDAVGRCSVLDAAQIDILHEAPPA